MSPTIRRTLFIMLTVAALVSAVAHLSGPNGVSAFMDKRHAIQTLQEENRLLENRVAEKTQYVEDIKAKKPEVVIPLIRKRTSWVRGGETDFRNKTPQPAAKPAGE